MPRAGWSLKSTPTVTICFNITDDYIDETDLLSILEPGSRTSRPAAATGDKQEPETWSICGVQCTEVSRERWLPMKKRL